MLRPTNPHNQTNIKKKHTQNIQFHSHTKKTYIKIKPNNTLTIILRLLIGLGVKKR